MNVRVDNGGDFILAGSRCIMTNIMHRLHAYFTKDVGVSTNSLLTSLKYMVFLFYFFILCNPGIVFAQCPLSDSPSSYVLLQVYKYSATSQKEPELKSTSTGVLISDKGLILTDYSLIEKDVIISGDDINLPKDIHIFALKESPDDPLKLFKVTPDSLEVIPRKAYEGRKLLLLETINIDIIKTLKLQKAKMVEVNEKSGSLKPCAVAYVPDNASTNKYKVEDDEELSLGDFDGKFLFRLKELDFKNDSAYGGAVFMDGTDQLMGIISSKNNDYQYMIPIEFADSLSPQVFLSDLKEKFNPVEKSYREQTIKWEVISTGLGNMCINYNKLIDGSPYLTYETTIIFNFSLEDTTSKQSDTTDSVAIQFVKNSDITEKGENFNFQSNGEKGGQLCLSKNGKVELVDEIKKFMKSKKHYLIKSVKLDLRPSVSWYSNKGDGLLESLQKVEMDIDMKALCNIVQDDNSNDLPKWLKGGCPK